MLYLFRHGQTDWAASGKHTGRSDIALNETGRKQATMLRAYVAKHSFSRVLVSPLVRAKETAILAGLEAEMSILDDLAEIDYGIYEGITTEEIRREVPNWTVWTDPCPGGESLAQAEARARNAIEQASKVGGNVAIFAHGHILRILTATWLGLDASQGKHFILETATASILGWERETAAIKLWNAPVEQ